MTATATNAKTERKGRTHEAILESAAQLLRARGVTGASVAEVMKGAGLTVGGFYAHFASKEALVAASLGRSMRELWTAMLTEVRTLPAEERFGAIVRRYLSRSHRDQSLDGCPLPAVVGDIARDGGELGDALAQELEVYAADVANEVPGATPEERRSKALATLATMYGGLSLARAVRGTPLSDEILKACRTAALGK